MIGQVELISGPIGSGKTALATKKQIKSYHNTKKTIKLVRDLYNYLNNNGYPNLKMPNCFVYSDYKTILDKKNNVESWCFDSTKMGLTPKMKGVTKFCIGADIYNDETQNTFSNRNWQNLGSAVPKQVSLIRHGLMGLTMVSQVEDNIDKKLRSFVHKVSFVTKMINVKIPFTNIILFSFWKVWEYSGSMKDAYEKRVPPPNFFQRIFIKLFGSLEEKLMLDIRSKIYFFNGNIFNHYNSYSGMHYFLHGVKKFDFNKHENIDLTKQNINKLCKSHPINAEELALLKKEETKQKVKENYKKIKEQKFNVKKEINTGRIRQYYC